MIGQALDEPFRYPAPEDLGNERGQSVESVHRLTRDNRPVNYLEATHVGGKSSVDAAIDKAAQTVRHRAHVSVLAQFHGNLLGANFTQVQASDNLVFGKVQNDPAPGAV